MEEVPGVEEAFIHFFPPLFNKCVTNSYPKSGIMIRVGGPTGNHKDTALPQKWCS